MRKLLSVFAAFAMALTIPVSYTHLGPKPRPGRCYQEQPQPPQGPAAVLPADPDQIQGLDLSLIHI